MGSRLLENWLSIPSTCSYTPGNSCSYPLPDKSPLSECGLNLIPLGRYRFRKNPVLKRGLRGKGWISSMIHTLAGNTRVFSCHLGMDMDNKSRRLTMAKGKRKPQFQNLQA